MRRLIPSRLVPTSLLGQVMASAMLALLVAQIVGAALLYRAGEDRLELSALTALAFQLSIGGEAPNRFRRPADLLGSGEGQERPSMRPPPEIDGPPLRPAARLPRPLRYRVEATPAVMLSDEATDSARTRRLVDLLEQEGITTHRVAVEVRRAGDDPMLSYFAQAYPRRVGDPRWQERVLYVASIQRRPGAPWETARVFERQRPAQGPAVLLLQTLIIYAFLGTILLLILRRITRPLAQLTERLDEFAKAPDRAVALEESGPTDTRRLIRAHNAMEAHIAALLDEKDVMLGAIGHDLKTPLAALRVRIESHPDDRQRTALAANIEEITRTLDDILSLARLGRAHQQAEATESVDITALAQSVVEEFEDMGDPVTLEVAEGARVRLVARVQQTWLKRGLRNLVSNAVRYGGSARVSVLAEDGTDSGTHQAITLRIEDDGPGIPEDRIADMLEPFTRGEASRNRATGGAGLGLTLARAIAEAHGGALVLANRPQGGLRAELRLPG